MRAELFAAAVIALPAVLIKPIEVAGESMMPTLRDGQIKLCIRKMPFRRGDIICVRFMGRLLIKRVTAVGGDMTPIGEVPKGMLYLTGDNREVSIDSSSGLGFIPRKCYVGKVI